MNQEFIGALKEIVKDKGISEDLLFTTIEDALVAAYKKNYAGPTSSAQNVKVTIDRETGEIHVYSQKVVVEEVFDELDNINVIYKCSDRDLQICTNKADFQTEVLHNIAEDIKRHALPYAEYANKLVIDKVVEIQITKDDDKVLIRVSNNGNPFKGNTDNLFNAGYHSGKYGRTGFGLASAKQFMQKIGGDIQFSPVNNYQVSFLHH